MKRTATLGLSLLVLFSTSAALAKTKSVKKETFAATEEVRVSTTSSAETKSPAAKQQAYDAVPEDQVQPLIKRLKLVEELITKHGRAYDYRVLTTKELEGILVDLTPKAKQEPVQEAIPEESDSNSPSY